MSEKTAPAAEGEEQPKKPKGKILIIAGAVLVLAGGGGGAWWFLNKDKKKDGAEEHVAKVEPMKPPVFVKLDAFTVNLQPEQGEQFLQVVAELKVANDETAKTVKDLMPEIRHRFLMLLSSKKPSQISTPQGRDTLAMEMRSMANQVVLFAQGRLQAQPPHMAPPAAPQGGMHGNLEPPTGPGVVLAAADAAKAGTTPPKADKPHAVPVAAPPQAAAAPAAAAPAAAPPAAAPPAAAAPAAAAPAAAVPAAPPAPAIPAATLVYSPRADDPIQSVLFTSFIIQ